VVIADLMELVVLDVCHHMSFRLEIGVRHASLVTSTWLAAHGAVELKTALSTACCDSFRRRRDAVSAILT